MQTSTSMIKTLEEERKKREENKDGTNNRKQ
jgi:hypothetical protein